MIASPDQHLDRILNALRDTTPPTGLAARVNARLLQATESPTRRASSLSTVIRRPLSAVIRPSLNAVIRPSLSAVILSFAKDPRILLGSPLRLAWAATACAAIIAVTLFGTRQHAPTIADRSSETPVPQNLSLASHPTTDQVAPRFSVGSHSPATNQVPQGFSLGSHGPSLEMEGVLTPDAIALAETLAPSHPAPPLPLTAQEALLLRSTRQGQPIEVAELETRRTSALTQIAEARERATVREYIHGLLGPLATAQTLTPPPLPSDDAKPAADSETPPSQ